MTEALLVFGTLVLLIAGGTATVVLPPYWLMGAGFAAVATGTIVGIPAGIYYHVVLRRQLLRHGPLPARWWLQPVRLHDTLSPSERRSFMPWFFVGGAGFVLIIAGAATMGLGLLRYQ